MSWCARHHFLDNIPSRHVSIAQWCTAVKERKTAAQDRAWPEPPRTNSQMGTIQPASLFIEEALANLGLSKEDDDEDNDHKDLLELNWLRQAPTVYTPISLRYAGSMQSSALYPPENVRAAVDLLFLEGTSDLILAKKAIVSSSYSTSRCTCTSSFTGGCFRLVTMSVYENYMDALRLSLEFCHKFN